MTVQTSHSIGPGKVLHVQDDVLYFCRGLEVLSVPVCEPGCTPRSHGLLPSPRISRPPIRSRLLGRLLRHEVRGFWAFPNGHLVASTRYGIFFQQPDSPWLPSAIRSPLGGEVALPLRLNGRPNGEVVFGEYFGNSERREVRVFASRDFGKSFSSVFTFPAGEVRHVHNIIPQRTAPGYWLLTGDFEKEPGIGSLDLESGACAWLIRGSQQSRAVTVFEDPDGLVYGTDSELEPNAVGKVAFTTGEFTKWTTIPGSCLYGHELANYRVVGTTVEPSKVNTSRVAELWICSGDSTWKPFLRGEKDSLPGRYFQYGSWVLPGGQSPSNRLFYSGKALKEADGQMYYQDLTSSVSYP